MNRRDPAMYHLVAVMLYAWSLVAVSIAWHSTALAAWLSATVVCYLAAIALFQALQASWRAWRGHKAAVPPPSATAPLWPTGMAGENHAEAIAVVAADTPLPDRTAVAYTAVMPTVKAAAPWAHKVAQPSGLPWMAPRRHARQPLPPTLPMSIEELAAVGRETVGGGW